MKGKHTQGSWGIVSQMPNGYTIENEQGKLICFSQCEDEDGEHTDEDMANLQLIKNAPQMLQMLKDLIYTLQIADLQYTANYIKAKELLNEISK